MLCCPQIKAPFCFFEDFRYVGYATKKNKMKELHMPPLVPKSRRTLTPALFASLSSPFAIIYIMEGVRDSIFRLHTYAARTCLRQIRLRNFRRRHLLRWNRPHPSLASSQRDPCSDCCLTSAILNYSLFRCQQAVSEMFVTRPEPTRN